MHTCFRWCLPETLNFRVDTGISWLWGLLGWSWCILQAIRHESGGLRVEGYESNCAPSKFICWSPTSQCDCIWSNKVIKVKWSHKGGTLISWYNRRHQRAYSLSPPCKDTGRRQPGRVFIRNWPCWTLIWDFSVFRTVRKYICLSHSFISSLLWQLELVNAIPTDGRKQRPQGLHRVGWRTQQWTQWISSLLQSNMVTSPFLWGLQCKQNNSQVSHLRLLRVL